MPELPRRIALINQKGGVGKTTTAVNLGAALANAGRRVLLADMDPQAHLTMHLGLEPGQVSPTVYEVLVDNHPVAEAIHDTTAPRLRVLPSTIDLAAAEVELVGVVGREVILRDALAALGEPPPYDYLLLDCPPSLGLLTLNALAVAEEVFICLQPHFLALQGVGKLLETVSLVYQRINPHLRVTGVVLCMYDTGTRLAGEVTDDLTGFLEEHREQKSPWSEARLFNTIVRRNIKLAECPSFGQDIFRYEPASHGAADYAALAGEVLAMEPGGFAPPPRAVDVSVRSAETAQPVELPVEYEPQAESTSAAEPGAQTLPAPEQEVVLPPAPDPSVRTPISPASGVRAASESESEVGASPASVDPAEAALPALQPRAPELDPVPDSEPAPNPELASEPELASPPGPAPGPELEAESRPQAEPALGSEAEAPAPDDAGESPHASWPPPAPEEPVADPSDTVPRTQGDGQGS